MEPFAWPGTWLALLAMHEEFFSDDIATGMAHPRLVRGLQLRTASR
jgi:hypothetical protein